MFLNFYLWKAVTPFVIVIIKKKKKKAMIDAVNVAYIWGDPYKSNILVSNSLIFSSVNFYFHCSHLTDFVLGLKFPIKI